MLAPFVPALSVLLVVLFLSYEFDETFRWNDEAFVDIREFMGGVFVGGAYLLARYYLGV